MVMTPISHIDTYSLSTTERLLLAQQLLDSVVAEAFPLSTDEVVEMQRRASDVDGGRVVCSPLDEVCARVLAQLRYPLTDSTPVSR